MIIGSGVSGIGAAKLLEQAGIVPTLYDSNAGLKEEEVRQRLPEGSRVKIVLGELPEELKKETELVVLSPGVPVDLPLVEDMERLCTRILDGSCQWEAKERNFGVTTYTYRWGQAALVLRKNKIR